MVDIRPNQLPSAIIPLRETDSLIVDQGVDGVRKTTPSAMTDSVAPVATQAEAVAGTDNTKRMTSLRTKQSIASEIGVSLASLSQGVKADSAIQSVNGKTGNSVTLVKGDIGLGNVDNTSDANKPISTATQAALDGKASSSQGEKADTAIQSINGKTGNSVTIVKGDLGLGNVDNTSDVNKPVSTATQTALDLKANSSVTISAGSGLTGGGNLTANRTVSLNPASISSLAKADSAVQTVNGVSPVAGNVTVSAEEKRLQDTRTTAIAESFANNVQFVETAGYSSVGDGGGALYKRVAAEPTHIGKFQSADGAWWEYKVNGPIRAAQFGVGLGAVNDATATTGMFNFAASREVTFEAGTYNYPSAYAAPAGSRVFFSAPLGTLTSEINFTDNRPTNLLARYQFRRSGTKGTSWQNSLPRLGVILEKADTYKLDSFQKQWSVSPTYWQWSDYEMGVHKEWNQNSDVAPNGWPQASFVGSAVSMPGNKDFPAGMHMLGFAMGNGGSVWGFNTIVGNNVDAQVAGGTPRFLCGGEIDMQPSQGSNLTGTTGAGLLINSFWTPVPFAGIAIVGDAGGSWAQGLYVGGIRSNGAVMQVASGTACLLGIDLSEASFSGAAIAIRNDDPILFKTSGGANGSLIEGDGAGNLHVRLAAPNTSMKVHAPNDGDNVEVFSVETSSGNYQGPVLRTANGAVPNTSAAAMWTRANSTTNRSINAGGTINASGADYAEYEYKAKCTSDVAKGQIIGFDSDGLITDKYSSSVSFGVKSTDPNIVGGDTWMRKLGERPSEPSFKSNLVWCGEVEPSYTKARSHEETDLLRQEWKEKYDAYKAEEAAEYALFLEGPHKEWVLANAEYDRKLEEARAEVDRIAYCGKVPVNVLGASVGQHVVPTDGDDDSITFVLVNDEDLTFSQHKKSVGRVRRILEDGRAEIVVKCS